MEEILEEELGEGRKWLAEVYGERATDFDVSIVVEELEGANEVLVVYSELPRGADSFLWWDREFMVNYHTFRFCEQNHFQPEGVHLVIFESYPHPSAEEFVRKFFGEAEQGEWPFEDSFLICDISWKELVEHYRKGQGERTEIFRDAEHCTRW